MAASVNRWLSWPSLMRTLVSHVRLTLRLLREPQVPLLVKAVPIVAGLYVLSPIDLIPDVVPILGQLDDLGVVVLALEAFLRWCPAPVVDYHRAAMTQGRAYGPMPDPGHGGDVIDAEFRREENPR
jgi:uncharacterized membrane protein YkvA (DUF1232 family)